MPRRNGTVDWLSSDSSVVRYRYWLAATPRANVTIARYRSLIRSAPAPITAASSAVDRARRAGSTSANGMSARTSAAAVSAPSPANAICPSESCPAQPVSSITDSTQIA